DFVSAYLGGSIPYMWKLVVGLAFVIVIVVMPRGFSPLIGAVGRGLLRSLFGRRSQERQSFTPTLVRANSSRATRARDGVSSIDIRDLRRRFGSLTVLDGIDFAAKPAELESLVGPNGAGKTTMIRCIADGAERTSG